MIERSASNKVLELAGKFPVISITGPRQSGKSTLAKQLFPNYKYVTLEDNDMRDYALDDPRGFLNHYCAPCIVDEAQRAPALFSYLQGVVDSSDNPAQYVLSGSQNFLLSAQISQSLAGRVAVLNLLPFSYAELAQANLQPSQMSEWLYRGGYPRIYDKKIDPADYFISYIQTYLERDIRQVGNVVKLNEFEQFLGVCAARNSQMLNKEELSKACRINVKTCESWLSVLNASFITTTLKPYYNNYGKRLTKTPKLYFLDSGLAANLVGLESADDVELSEFKGALFESAVVSEIYKNYLARGRRPKLYYWRDSDQKEVDFLIEKGSKPYILIEVKSSATYTPKFFKNLDSVGELLSVPADRRFVVYAGKDQLKTTHGAVIPFAYLNSVL